jgi:hypothetical protein
MKVWNSVFPTPKPFEEAKPAPKQKSQRKVKAFSPKETPKRYKIPL